MSATWRMAGLNYVNYSNIAAGVLRRSVKGAKKDEPAGGTFMRFFFWANGEMLPDGKKPEKSEASAKPG